MSETIDDAIERAAIDGVQNVSADGVSVTSMDPLKQIEVAKYLDRKSAASKNHLGFTFKRIQFGDTG